MRWVDASEAADIEWTPQRNSGCPPPPALCRPHDVFDAIFVLSHPQSQARAERVCAQLDAAGVEYVLIQRHNDDAEHETHKSLLAVVEAAQLRSVLFLEDDITLAANFPSAFDSSARSAPRDWQALWFCWLSTGFMMVPVQKGGAAASQRWVPPKQIFQSCAVALSASAAALVHDVLTTKGGAIDAAPFDAVIKRWPTRVLALWPPAAVAPRFSVSEGPHSFWGDTPRHWAAVNGVAQERFDVLGEGYRAGGGLLAARPVCTEFEPGVDFRGSNLLGPALGVTAAGVSAGKIVEWSAVAMDSPAACCVACGAAWPLCRAWTLASRPSMDTSGLRDCWLKSSEEGRAAADDATFVSGRVAQGRGDGGGDAVSGEDSALALGFREDLAEAPGWPGRAAGEGFVYCVASSGLADCLNQLWRCADYAQRQQYKRVYFDMPRYAAARLAEVFDISRFPVPLTIGHSVGRHIDALFLSGKLTGTYHLPAFAYSATNSVARSSLLIMNLDSSGSTGIGVVRHMSLAPSLKAQWLTLRARFPARYSSVHVRNTDKKLPIVDIDALFLEMPPDLPIVFVTDDSALAKTVAACRPDVFQSPARLETTTFNLHSMGYTEDYILAEAVLDLLLIASGVNVVVMKGMTNVRTNILWGEGLSGFSQLAVELNSCERILLNFIHGNVSLVDSTVTDNSTDFVDRCTGNRYALSST